mgnify:CR=1 FL=1
MPQYQTLANYLIDGEEEKLLQEIQALLSQTQNPLALIDEGLIPGMTKIGELFKEGELFIPEVMMSAQLMTKAVDLIRPFIKEEEVSYHGKIIIGTVKGDLHDIGKNLVALLLEANGFDVINLGCDQGANEFLQAVEQYQPDIVALSALLTTTMPGMSDIIQAIDAKQLRPSLKVIIGGAPVSQEYADKIHADGYSEDATGAVELCKQLLQIS